MEILRSLRKKAKKTQEQMGKILGITQQAYAAYENDKTTPSAEILQRLANYFGVTVDYLLRPNEIHNITNGYIPENIIAFPIITTVKGGYEGQLIEEHDSGEYLPIPVEFLRGRSPEDFMVFEIKGDSMYPRLLNGDRVLVLRTESVSSGTTAVVIYNGDEATVKRVEYKEGEDWIDLIPANPEYKTKRISGSDLQQCRIIGEVKMLLRTEI